MQPETRQMFVCEPHDAEYGPYQCEAHLALAGIQRRRSAVTGAFRTLYAYQLTDRAKAKALRGVKAARKALLTGRTVRPVRFV